MNLTNDNYKHGLLPKRSELISLLGMAVMVFTLCMILAMTYNIRFPMLVKGRGMIIRNAPPQAGYCITASFSEEDAKKIQPGQKVWLLLTKYPADSYGRINGRVQHIAKAGSTQWDVTIRLQNSFVTDKNRTIPVVPELTGDVFVVVKDLSLLQRIL